MATQRQLIAADVITRLQRIESVGGEFETNAGQNVFIGERPGLGEDDADEALAIVFGDDSVTKDTPKTYITLPIEVQAVVKVTLTNAWLRIESMLGDIKRAMEKDTANGRRELAEYPLRRGATRVLDREPGAMSVGVGVTYYVDYSEAWGTP